MNPSHERFSDPASSSFGTRAWRLPTALSCVLLALAAACGGAESDRGPSFQPEGTNAPRGGDERDGEDENPELPSDGGARDGSAGDLPTFARAKLATLSGPTMVCRITDRETVRCTSQRVAALRGGVDLPGIAGAQALSRGLANACALTKGGEVKCWGTGALGDGTRHESYVLADVVTVKGLSDVDAIVDGGDDAHCARTRAGKWFCWGANGDGQFGLGTTGDVLTPVEVPIAADAVAVAIGGRHLCYAQASGAVRCAGFNDVGQLGDGTKAARATFGDVVEKLPSVAALSASHCAKCSSGATYVGRTTCALQADGALSCWGQNLANQLGDGSGKPQAKPVDASIATAVTQIAVGNYASCVLDAAGKASCWGLTGYTGVRGSAVGALVSPLASGVAELSASDFYACALMASGGVKCWGAGPNPVSDAPAPVPTDAPGL